MKALTPIQPAQVTTTQRNSIPTGTRGPGAIVWNSTTGTININFGTDAIPNWQGA